MTAPVSFLRPVRRAAMAHAVATAAFALVAGGSPIAASAQLLPYPYPYPLLPNPNPDENTIRIGDQRLIPDTEYFQNAGVVEILNSGSLANDGILDNQVTGSVINNGNLRNNGGTINSGFLINNLSFENEGELSNYKSLQNTSDMYNGINNAASKIVNDGINSGVLALFENSGNLQNFTELTNTNNAILVNTGFLQNFGLLDNRDIAFFRNYGRLINTTSGSLNNSATFENFNVLQNNQLSSLNNRSGGFLFNQSGATLTNYGTLVNERGSTLHNFGIIEDHAGVKNLGNLFNYKNLNVIGALENESGTLINTEIADMQLSGRLVNTLFGTLNNLGSFVSQLRSVIQNSGSFTNAGPNARLTVNGGIFNQSTGTLTNGPYGTVINNGSIINDGHLNNGAPNDTAPLATLINRGSITNNDELSNNVGGRAYNYNSIINDGIFTNSGRFENALGASVSGKGRYIQDSITGLTLNNGTMTQAFFDISAGRIIGHKAHFIGDMNLTNGVKLEPGQSPGTMTIDGNLNSGADMLFEIAGLIDGEEYDVLEINGDANFDGGLITIAFIAGFLPDLDDTFDFLLVSGGTTGWESLELLITGLEPGFEGAIRLGARGLFFDITAVPGTVSVPEPGTTALVLAGLGLAGFMSRRRKALAG